MSKKPLHLRSRIAVSRVFVAGVILLMLCSSSRWGSSHPVVSALIFALGCVLVGIATMGRLWCGLYISGYKTRSLISVGPYSMSRNPLYLFSLIGAVGVGMATETLLIPLLISIAFALYYPAIIKAEEVKLLGRHPDAYGAYCAGVPRFLPDLSLLKEPDEYVVSPRLFRKSLVDALWFVWLIGILEFVEALREVGYLPTRLSLY